MRDLPACLLRQEPANAEAEGEAEREGPSAAPLGGGGDGTLQVWSHPLFLDTEPTGLALLLPGLVPEAARSFAVGAQGQRVACRLGGPHAMRLTRGALADVAHWLVGSLELIQGGCAGEPLHASMGAMQQLLAWDHVSGSFRPDPRRILDGREGQLPELRGFKFTNRWVKDPSSEPAAFAALVQEMLLFYKAPLPVVVTLDLDQTLWFGECAEWPPGTYESGSAATGAFPLRMVSTEKDETGRYPHLELHRDVPLIFGALRLLRASNAVRIAIASASPARGSALALLEKFGLIDGEMWLEIGDGDGGDGSGGATAETTAHGKVGHLRRLAKRMGVPEEEVRERFVLFDDSERNVDSVREEEPDGLHCNALVLDPATGLTAEAVARGLEHHCKELQREREDGFDGRLTEAERLAPDREQQRKMRQDRLGRRGERQAEVDGGRASDKLRALRVDPGWWVAAPLDGEEVDWRLVELATRLFKTCEWPGCGSDHPLAALWRRGRDDEDAEWAYCALATYDAETRVHYQVLSEVSFCPADGTVQGTVRTRQAKVAESPAPQFLASTLCIYGPTAHAFVSLGSLASVMRAVS